MGGALLLIGKTNNSKRQHDGQNILMAGLAINLASFCFFFTLIIWYEVATRRIVKGLKRSYSPIIYALIFSQFFLIGRSIYRIIEFLQGYFSHIATTEFLFYIFDCMLMIFATAIYVPLFPPVFGLLGNRRLVHKVQSGDFELNSRTRMKGPASGQPSASSNESKKPETANVSHVVV